MPEPKAVLAEPPETSSLEPRAGFARAGNAATALQEIGSHTRCDRTDLHCRSADLS